MPLPDHQIPENRGIDWRAVGRTLFFQVLVVLALTGAFIAYIDWSSERAFSEFMSAGKPSQPSAYDARQSLASVQPVKGQAFCRRKD